MPLKYSLELRKNRNLIDEHEKDEDYLKRSEECYIELSELYNWSKVECVRNDQIRSIEDINNEIYDIIKSKDN